MTTTAADPSEAEQRPRCGAPRRSGGERNIAFICVAPEHPEMPTAHVFRRDLEAPLSARPSNAELESSLEAFFRQEVRKLGGYAVKTMPTVKGFPDRLVFFPGGITYLVELKAEKGTVSPAQRVQHQRLSQLGTSVTVLTGKTEVRAWLKAHLDRIGPRFRGYSE